MLKSHATHSSSLKKKLAGAAKALPQYRQVGAVAAPGVQHETGRDLDQLQPFEHACGDFASQETRFGNACRDRK